MVPFHEIDRENPFNYRVITSLAYRYVLEAIVPLYSFYLFLMFFSLIFFDLLFFILSIRLDFAPLSSFYTVLLSPFCAFLLIIKCTNWVVRAIAYLSD